MKSIILTISTLLTLSFPTMSQSIIDLDGNVYDTVVIGNQTWLKQDLKVTKYRNGDTIMTIDSIPTLDWGNDAKYQWAYNNNDSIAQIYGRLYTWHTINDNRDVCPADWHVPDMSDWDCLIDYLGGMSQAASKLKETGDDHWDHDYFSTNESDFTSIPGGGFYLNGFGNLGVQSNWWCSDEYNSEESFHLILRGLENSLAFMHGSKSLGYSVRCIKGEKKIVTSQKLNFWNNEIFIYPNPTDEILYFSHLDPNSSFSIFDIQGKLIVSDQTNTEIDISFLTSGMYVILLRNSEISVYFKLIKR